MQKMIAAERTIQNNSCFRAKIHNLGDKVKKSLQLNLVEQIECPLVEIEHEGFDVATESLPDGHLETAGYVATVIPNTERKHPTCEQFHHFETKQASSNSLANRFQRCSLKDE